MQSAQQPLLDRRSALAILTSGIAATTLVPATARARPLPIDCASALRAAFAPTATGGLNVSARLALLLPAAIVIEHDVPFPMNITEYADHLAFHAAQWDKLETELHELVVAPHGNGAVVSAFYNERGKPKGAGFRLRAGFCTAMCTKTASGWRALSLHRGPLSGQILDSSPS